MSCTQTETKIEPPTLILTLRIPPEEQSSKHRLSKTKKVTWDSEVIDNEFLNKKKINCCPDCTHKRKNLFMPK